VSLTTATVVALFLPINQFDFCASIMGGASSTNGVAHKALPSDSICNSPTVEVPETRRRLGQAKSAIIVVSIIDLQWNCVHNLEISRTSSIANLISQLLIKRENDFQASLRALWTNSSRKIQVLLSKLDIDEIKREIFSFLDVESHSNVSLYNGCRLLDPRYACDDYGSIQDGSMITAVFYHPHPNCRIEVNFGHSQPILDICLTYQVKILKRIIFPASSSISQALYLEDMELADDDASLEFYGISNNSCVKTSPSCRCIDVIGCPPDFMAVCNDMSFRGGVPVTLLVFQHCFVLLDYELIVYRPASDGSYQRLAVTGDHFHIEPVLAIDHMIYASNNDQRISTVNVEAWSTNRLNTGHDWRAIRAMHPPTSTEFSRIMPSTVTPITQWLNGVKRVYQWSRYTAPYGTIILETCEDWAKFSIYFKPKG
jgi:hypothetical protein